MLTNECRYTRENLAQKLNGILDSDLTIDQIYTAGNSTRDFFSRLFRHGFNASSYVIGEDGLFENMLEAYGPVSS